MSSRPIPTVVLFAALLGCSAPVHSGPVPGAVPEETGGARPLAPHGGATGDEAATPERAAEAAPRQAAPAPTEAGSERPATGPDATAASADAPAPLPPEAADLVDVQTLIPDLVLDLRYATENNFVGRAVYPESARCFLRRPVAERLARVAQRLREEDGTRLRVFDCYRPLSVQWKLWEIFPQPGYVADPRQGSVHNRGAAVDLTLATPDGEALPMPTEFDTFDERAWHSFRGGPPETLRNRERLRRAMVDAGFTTIPKEWWHYEAPDRSRYPVLDVSFERLAAGGDR